MPEINGFYMTTLDADDYDARSEMTRRDLSLEMIRSKRAHPVYDRVDDVTYASISEMARAMGFTPQKMHRIVKSQYGRMRYDTEEVSTQPYADLKACETLEEYVLHYIRKYYPSLASAHYHLLDASNIVKYNRLRMTGRRDLLLEVSEGCVFDVFPYDHPEGDRTRVCALSDLGSEVCGE